MAIDYTPWASMKTPGEVYGAGGGNVAGWDWGAWQSAAGLQNDGQSRDSAGRVIDPSLFGGVNGFDYALGSRTPAVAPPAPFATTSAPYVPPNPGAPGPSMGNGQKPMGAPSLPGLTGPAAGNTSFKGGTWPAAGGTTPLGAPGASVPGPVAYKPGGPAPGASGLPAGMGYRGAFSGAPNAGGVTPPWGSSGAAGNENRTFSQTGTDPMLDWLYRNGLTDAISNYRNAAGRTFYPGQTVAGLTPDEQQAQQLLRGAAGTVGQHGSSASGFLESILANARNPGANSQVDDAVATTMRDVTNQTLGPGGAFSQIRDNALGTGTYGGTRQGVLESLGMQRLSDSLGATSANMRLGARGQDINAGMSGLSQAGNVGALNSMPASFLSGVGAQNRGIDQANIDSNIGRWLYDTNQPDVALRNLFNFGGSAPLGGWSSGQSWLSDAALNSGGGTSTGQNVAGGIAAGGALWQILRNAGIL